MLRALGYLFLFFLATSLAHPEVRPARLTAENFFQEVGHGRNVLVKFYAPWCGHCRSMAAAYERLADTYASSEDVLIAEIDADRYYEFCDRFGIPGYPSLRLFTRDSTNPISYNGNRSYEDMRDFIERHKTK